MSSVSNEVFLISCLNHSANGTINWDNVIAECGIVSKGAANIKLKRLKDKYSGGAANTAAPASATKKSTPKTKGTPSKKRKVASDEDGAETTPIEDEVKVEDDDELA